MNKPNLQQKLKLAPELKLLLKDCEELWIAVAMISDYGYQYIQEHIHPNAKQHFLTGIGLPTSPRVLRQFMIKEDSEAFEGKVYHKPNELFHPKVYIISTGGELIALVGSGNCTNGGFEKNKEVSIKSTDQAFCNELLKWFNTLFKHGKPVTEEFLQQYEKLFAKRAERTKQDTRELAQVFGNDDTLLNLDTIDFTEQFFKKEHFEAFEGRKPIDPSPAINAERQEVRKQLYHLHELLMPEIRRMGWNLQRHYSYDDTVSSAVHGIYTADELSAVWLYYGRGKREIKAFGEDQTPINFMRLQVIVHKDNIGIWNCVGKNHGSRIEREHLKRKLRASQQNKDELYGIISALPDSYYIMLNDEPPKFVSEFASANELADFLLRDDFTHYFIIGTEFPPQDERLSNDNIIDTIIDNFGLLYRTYLYIKPDQ